MVKNTKKITNVKTAASLPRVAQTTQTNNAVIYCRVSTKNQTNGTSLDSQEYYCKQYFKLILTIVIIAIMIGIQQHPHCI